MFLAIRIFFIWSSWYWNIYAEEKIKTFWERSERDTLWRLSDQSSECNFQINIKSLLSFSETFCISVLWNEIPVQETPVLFFPTVRPDSDGSKRAAHSRTYLPLVWMACTYQSLVPVTAVAMGTAFQGCVSVTWGTLVRLQACLMICL